MYARAYTYCCDIACFECQNFKSQDIRTACICASLRRRVKKFRFLADTKKAAPKMRATREKMRGKLARVFSRALQVTQQIVLSEAINIDRDAAHPHTRVHLHTHTLTHIHTITRIHVNAIHKGHTKHAHKYMQFRPESKRHIKEKSTSLSRCALTLKLKVDQKR